MIFTHTLQNGQTLEISNNDKSTNIGFSSSGSSQQQSQSRGFNTDAWTEDPALYQVKNNFVLKISMASKPVFLSIRGDEISEMNAEPDLNGAEQITLKKSDKPAVQPMKPMEPMKPMAPMKPMRPM